MPRDFGQSDDGLRKRREAQGCALPSSFGAPSCPSPMHRTVATLSTPDNHGWTDHESEVPSDRPQPTIRSLISIELLISISEAHHQAPTGRRSALVARIALSSGCDGGGATIEHIISRNAS